MIIRLQDATVETGENYIVYKPDDGERILVNQGEKEYEVIRALIHVVVQLNEEVDTHFNNVSEIVDIEE
jgi:hypothetical protein